MRSCVWRGHGSRTGAPEYVTKGSTAFFVRLFLTEFPVVGFAESINVAEDLRAGALGDQGQSTHAGRKCSASADDLHRTTGTD